ncbi:2-keto-4-pentenoate hydratase/2-oxohepta-3-ene-1,7-dioic acid hydratase (catechol pathway) [Lutimaribacter pacificus]|uniref:2-keto-4-pentenoate hydratase/2-oxohepta-3-ene-1,7-dioic acid hydratase (Catechol pathway) n=1 Tax=Lutimaribacter pacificus TaxID=391948 RepID=A0A1H0CF02_9RHOB|nr:fumarylacetoacetate hydrolase family protein [Lutimaribacter pacificus]SDN56440.1 2-keto-4-pentenoate hydratase/2-oxohepta-3-ene-1,7-dioic acid hydratase (catechol pathway) [Lutimaribacter pacificus]SHJ45212.1 2-keto-4-pentenoate hydratase/2-oxohepta-3-ene-1,7-dioic acid hydratase (catechol pathway) [Lutimaribacter pacificus]
MKLCSFTKDGTSSYGLVTEAGIVDLGKRFDAPTLRDFLATGDMAAAAGLASEPADFAFDEVAHDPVIPNPDKIICVGLNYHAHIEETGREETPNPVLFARFAGSQIGHDQPLVKPLESDRFDYEGEVAVIIGKEGRRISEADALDHVAGYACYNDGSVRDWQKHTHQFMPGKTFAGTGGFGPWMTTADEIPDPAAMRLQTRLNGETVQDTTLDLLVASIPRLIAYCSTILPLLPGDVIVSGTPGGVGARRNPPLFMKDGDVCEVEVSGVGILRNPVVAES